MNARRRCLLRSAAAFGIGGLSGLGGCSLFTPMTHTPMDVLRPGGGHCEGRAPVLLVMLPGAYSRPPEFVSEGYVAAVHSRGIAADVAIANAHLGYFNDRSVLTRLREDVVLPARAQGYRRIWLVGISLGGFAALGYGARHADEVDGIVVIAPYLGTRLLLQEIAAAGGPAAWRAAQDALPPREADDESTSDREREVWAWLTAPAAEAMPARPPIYLGHGREDRFVDGHRMLATVLPADRSDDVPGGHDWPAWRALWSHWLDRGLLPTDCKAT